MSLERFLSADGRMPRDSETEAVMLPVSSAQMGTWRLFMVKVTAVFIMG